MTFIYTNLYSSYRDLSIGMRNKFEHLTNNLYNDLYKLDLFIQPIPNSRMCKAVLSSKLKTNIWLYMHLFNNMSRKLLISIHKYIQINGSQNIDSLVDIGFLSINYAGANELQLRTNTFTHLDIYNELYINYNYILNKLNKSIKKVNYRCI